MPPRDPAAYDEAEDEDFEGLEDLEEEDVEGQGDDGGTDGGSDEGPEAAGETRGREADEEDGQRRLLRSRDTPAKRLSRQLQEEATARRRLENELAELRASQQRQQTREETPEQEAAKLAMMDPEERSEYRLNKVLARTEAQNRALQFQMVDQADKSNFATLAASNQLYGRMAKKVEEKLAELRAKGQNVDRETLAKYLIGEAVAQRGPKAVSRAKAAGDRNLRRERGRPSAGRSDQSVDRRTAKGKYAHLEDVVF